MNVVLAALALQGEALVDPVARSKFPSFLIQCGEGSLNWMYLDQAEVPNVTTGIGNLLSSVSAAQSIDWVRPDGTPATSYDVQQAWNAVRARTDLAKDGGGAFEPVTSIRATASSVSRLVQSRIDGFESSIRPHWPGWDDAPGPAQEALMRLAWATGAANLAERWPKLHTYWAAKDWIGCATECDIPALDKTEPKANEYERDLFLQAAELGYYST